MKLSSAQHDRAVGSLIGLATGDALGAAYEFHTPGPDHPVMKGGGAFNWAPGEWTDDTQMAICITEEAATGRLDPLAVGERFLRWFRSGPPDVGNQTRSILGSTASADELTEKALDYHRKRPDSSDGNGSLMRTAPVALAHLDDDDALWTAAQEISALTHAGADSKEACSLWCTAIAEAIREGSSEGPPSVLLRRVLLLACLRTGEGSGPTASKKLSRRNPNSSLVTAVSSGPSRRPSLRSRTPRFPNVSPRHTFRPPYDALFRSAAIPIRSPRSREVSSARTGVSRPSPLSPLAC